ncbi:site-specific integrase [Paenibacillus albicereus]|uniref:Site-specific integrase n=1 Tax=Paenibacillus albicereus TaxID=2726185 RepID=A0A6H2GZW2_9BACL|nr:tyrosine-type recombinase/integrase [Paenibacillus albicereus]QJC52937.1 site-specific integrase [Paenibacillus albicereus]
MASFTKIPANNKQGYKWVCIKDGPPDPATGARNQVKRRGDTKKEAEARCDEAIKKLGEHGLSEKDLKQLPFGRVAAEWLETYVRGGAKPGTIQRRKDSLKIIFSFMEHVNINRITPKLHQSMLNELFDSGYSKSTLDSVHVAANLVYKHALKERYIQSNPAAGATIPVKVRTVEEIENNPVENSYLERGELHQFLATVNEHGLTNDAPFFYLMAFSGLRIGEALALKWTDVDFETGNIRVTKTLYAPRNNMRTTVLLPPKTTASIREFDLDEDVMKLLKTHKAQQNQRILEKRLLTADFHNGNYVFANDSGYPTVHRQIEFRMKRLLKKSGLKKPATPHFFRHTHISMLTEAKVDLKTIMDRVGHDDPKTTLKIYTHVTEKMKKDAGQKLSSSYSDILKGLILQDS